MRRLFCLLLLASAVLLTPSASVAQTDWVSTDWIVTCEDDVPDAVQADCDYATSSDANSAPLTTGPVATTQLELEKASVWLNGLGFRGPEIETVSGTYRARLTNDMGENTLGYYYQKQLFVNPLTYFAVGEGDTEDERQTDLAWNSANLMTMVHELFHGVQESYLPNGAWTDGHMWITEGTAEVIEFAWIKTEYPAMDFLSRPRVWDLPLHRPMMEQDTLYAYKTSYFWASVGKRFGSPHRIAYLHDLLQEDLVPHRGLEGVDDALRDLHPKGLYDIYPYFIAYDLETKHREHFFSEIPDRDIQVTESAPDADATWSGESVLGVATEAYNLRVSAPAGKSVGVVVRIKDDHEDLHLIVEGERADRMPFGEEERNVYRTTVHPSGDPVELDVRVANVAPDAIDSEKQTFDLEVNASLVDPCSSSQMLATVHREVVFASPRRPELFAQFGVSDVGSGTLTLGGAGDAGVACTFPLSALTADGAVEIGRATDAEARASTDARLDGMHEQAQRMDSIASGEMSDDDHRAMLDAVNDLRETMNSTGGSSDDDGSGGLARDVVVEVFSPNAWTWRAMTPGDPHQTRHGGVGGWQPNAASHLLIQLVETRPEDLEEGETYEAAAFAPAPDDSSDPSIVPTQDGFYSRWTGEYTGIRFSEPELRRACQNGLQQLSQITDQRFEVQGTDARMAERGDRTCDYSDFAYQGDEIVVSGSLSGTVTIDRITSTVVTGRFELNGSGTKHVTTYSYRYDDDGTITGDEEEDSEQTLSLRAEGTFRAPNGPPGLFRINHESISIKQ